MSEKKIIIATGVMLSILILPSVSSLAYAQYLPTSGQTGLDDYLKLSQERVIMANENPHTGSGTPMFALDGVVGAMVLSTGVFGGVATAFFVKGRKGKYAAMGRG
ncbi:MAG: hypothetical protein OEM17_01530 [Nitrosopumilus sp.]|nr:hypothetical protein [Nitrosopumilus sp.]